MSNNIRKKVKVYEDLIPIVLYGMAKVHEENVLLRPVASMLGTPEYTPAKFLDRIIVPYMPDTYLLRSTELHAQKMTTVVSFDVISLFTNVPLKETIEIVIDYLYADTINVMHVDKKIFRRLVYFATQEVFRFNEKLYKLVDGVIIGNPLGPTLANFFLGHLEKKLFANLENNSPMLRKLYIIFVDNVHAVFANTNSCLRFFLVTSILNFQHHDIRFTMEKTNKTLNFLDVKIELNDVGLNTCVWLKPTNTGLLLNFYSICSTT